MLAPRKSRIFGGSFFPQLSPASSAAASAQSAKSNSQILGAHSSRKLKIEEKPKENPKLVFDYGPDSYKGLVAHRKIKIAQIAEHIQVKYPDVDVFYRPVTDFDLLTVRLQGSIVFTSKLSKLDRSPSGLAARKIEDALCRLNLYPDLTKNPFRDPMTLMTHNLDVDFDYPWYRTPVCRAPNFKRPEKRQRVSFENSIVGQCQVVWDAQDALWNRFLDRVEASPDFENLLRDELLNAPQKMGFWKTRKLETSNF